MRPGTIIFLLVAGTLILLSALIGLKVYQKSQEVAVEQRVEIKKVPVHVLQVSRGTIEDVVLVTGVLEAAERVDCYAKIPYPGKLISARVKKGDRVSKDQILATVDRDEVGATYLPYPVKAPTSGYIAYIQDEPGSLVAAQQPVATIIVTNEMKVKTTVLEKDLGRLKEGLTARVRVDAYPDRVFTGTLTKINPVLDELSHTAPVEITMSNSDQALKPSMFARVELVVASRSGVVVPREVMLRREGKNRVFLVYLDDSDKENPLLRIKLQEVQLGYHDAKNYEVLSGLNAGDLVVDQDLLVLREGVPITIVNPPPGWTDPTAPSSPPPTESQGNTITPGATPQP